MTREIHNKTLNFEDFTSAINRLDAFAQDPSGIVINFPKSDTRDTKDFFNRFFGVADGNPEWNV